MGILDILKGAAGGRSAAKGQKAKCPNCGEQVTLDMIRCPKCGVRIKSMFRRKCPKCQTLNELDISKCKKCGYDFEPESGGPKKTYFLCPICKYKMTTFMTRCPACNTRFV
ncbi:zinc ribbon domain-containing protein [Candidatus Micrarchaeota archaeon]|nr:zinc ribbon domain-containing protein [Candidatus Micrarchaeota archaeon]